MIEIKKEWLVGETLGGVQVQKVERAPSGRAIERSHERISKSQAPNGVMHTTEGHWGPSLEVFTNTGTPHFLIGYNTINRNNTRASGPLRIGQLAPIGEMALTLVNSAGGTETNREALVQIELIAFSKFEPWLPPAPVTKALAALLERIEDICGIPLQRAGNGSRSVALWDGKAGWFGHGEVPENNHTDPRNLKWNELFAAAPHETAAFWEVWAGGKLLHRERQGGEGEADAYDRLVTWLDNHEAAARAAEREHGRLTIAANRRPI